MPLQPARNLNDPHYQLFHLFVRAMLSTKPAVFFYFEPIWIVFLVFHCRIISALAISTR